MVKKRERKRDRVSEKVSRQYRQKWGIERKKTFSTTVEWMKKIKINKLKDFSFFGNFSNIIFLRSLVDSRAL